MYRAVNAHKLILAAQTTSRKDNKVELIVFVNVYSTRRCIHYVDVVYAQWKIELVEIFRPHTTSASAADDIEAAHREKERDTHSANLRSMNDMDFHVAISILESRDAADCALVARLCDIIRW